MDLELRPACFDIQIVDLLTEILRILVTFLQVLRRQTNQMNLKWHSLPLFWSKLLDELLNVVNNTRRQDVEDIECVESALDSRDL